jgi:two-component system, LytTR family, response regulator
VMRFEAIGDYVAVHAASGMQLLHLSLNKLETRLDPQRFVRIHRSHIVNLDQVKAFRRQDASTLVAVMADGAILPVSRSRAQGLRHLAV